MDYLSKTLGGNSFKKNRNFEYEKFGNLILVKPLVYMNASGAAVSTAIKYFKIPLQNLIIAHDDSDLTIGKFKIAVGQRPAGHHGIESVIKTLGTNNFARLRIGVRPIVERKRKKAGDFILKPISIANRKILEKVFEAASAEITNF
jgi:PTH1 family peptidyl-tRNA hydrolase